MVNDAFFILIEFEKQNKASEKQNIYRKHHYKLCFKAPAERYSSQVTKLYYQYYFQTYFAPLGIFTLYQNVFYKYAALLELLFHAILFFYKHVFLRNFLFRTTFYY